jgi:hypothetical protein
LSRLAKDSHPERMHEGLCGNQPRVSIAYLGLPAKLSWFVTRDRMTLMLFRFANLSPILILLIASRATSLRESNPYGLTGIQPAWVSGVRLKTSSCSLGVIYAAVR